MFPFSRQPAYTYKFCTHTHTDVYVRTELLIIISLASPTGGQRRIVIIIIVILCNKIVLVVCHR